MINFPRKIWGGVFFLFLASVSAQDLADFPDRFTVTGYYSPLPNQSFYVTGDYQSEIRLNGRGVAGADGTGVFSGMLAAPKNYPFGTQICLKDLGCGQVHDRGQAIVNKGVRRLARHDRLDVWMGYGEEGLIRALQWGIRDIEGRRIPTDERVAIGFQFATLSSLDTLLGSPVEVEFPKNLRLGDQGEAVQQLAKALTSLDYFSAENLTIFNKELQSALLAFQEDQGIINSGRRWGAGVFGPQSREVLAVELKNHWRQQRLWDLWQTFRFEAPPPWHERTLSAYKLQRFLVSQEQLSHVVTGFYSTKTRAALESWQREKGLLNAQQKGGYFGDKTRTTLNEALDQQAQLRQQTLQRIAEKRQTQEYWQRWKEW